MEAIEQPFGVSVFGSAVLRVAPDIALVKFQVSSLKQTPQEAFQDTQSLSEKVTQFLKDAGQTDFGSSRIMLRRRETHRDEFLGYSATTEFHLHLTNLAAMEETLLGVVEAGANEIKSVTYHTSRLKDLRAEVRKQAVAAAREKAELYCQAANAKLGDVIHVLDINPERLQERSSHSGVYRDLPTEIEDDRNTFDPSAITVGGAVMLAFSLA